ncbi:QacE family quaternary ammonium compound efflux SMR transporter [Tumebacillus algifaecis]|uniref:QacE family quaternary ammonium compound efflux SMR transporter n=1 Tax=Tumebacillus algifaecis TaxID=1214604 RepID=A0A223CXE0_9BACL|nr:multidrug efflux SMR transporter [Tumebacillus algifaecis]ASS74059.1 QacE family quaternary ammonium compound efflux SMR transporter [Tumebacillus algifaecis]
MGWLYLILAGLGEVFGVAGINRINEKKDWQSYAIFTVGFLFSFGFLTLAMESIAMSTAYAVWTGIGTVGSVVLGMLFYGESKEWRRMLYMSMVLAAAVGLKLIS